MSTKNLSAPDARSWPRRLLNRAFPAKLAPMLEDKEGWAPGYMITHVVINLSWRDRLRALVGGNVHILISTRTDVDVKKVYSESVAWVAAPE
jgi:hypothetical protein